MTKKLPATSQPAPSVPTVFDGEIYQNVGKYARSAVLYAFQKMGGPEALTEWAEENKDDFYTKLYPKIIARESEVTHHKTVDQLMDIIDGEYEVEGAVDGEFDEFDVTELPGAIQPSAPIAPNWNATDYDFDNDVILAEEVETVGIIEPDGFDMVEFES